MYGEFSMLKQTSQKFRFQTSSHLFPLTAEIFQQRYMAFPNLLLDHPTDEFSITILTRVSEGKKYIG